MNLRKRRRRRLIALLVGCLLLLAVLLYRFRYEPTLAALAVTQVENVTANLVYEAVDEELAGGKIQYDSLIHLEKSPDGTITALTTDMYAVNYLKSELLELLSSKIADVSSEELGVPLGSVMMPMFFAGRGPTVPVRYSAVRYADATFHNQFEQAGINQTLHQIVLRVDISVTVLLPTGTMDVDVSTDMVIAQTVIVGEVPQTVISMTGENNGTEG